MLFIISLCCLRFFLITFTPFNIFGYTFRSLLFLLLMPPFSPLLLIAAYADTFRLISFHACYWHCLLIYVIGLVGSSVYLRHYYFIYAFTISFDAISFFHHTSRPLASQGCFRLSFDWGCCWWYFHYAIFYPHLSLIAFISARLLSSISGIILLNFLRHALLALVAFISFQFSFVTPYAEECRVCLRLAISFS